MRHTLVGPLVCVLVSSCDSVAERYPRDLQLNARYEAADVAADRCGGHFQLVAGRSGLSPDDYRCVAQAPRVEPVPATYACKMEDGSSIAVSVLTEMSGEIRDGVSLFQLKYPIFQSNDTLVLVRA